MMEKPDVPCKARGAAWRAALAAMALAVWAGASSRALAQGPASKPAAADTKPAPVARLVGKQHEKALHASLVGRWEADLGKEKVQLTLDGKGGFLLGVVGGTYRLEGSLLKLRGREADVAYSFELAGSQLTLSGGDLAQPVKFTRAPDSRTYAQWLFDLSPGSIARKLWRVLTVVLVAVACRLVLLLLRATSRFVIYSEWGPLKRLYRTRKNRALTIHSLGLNLCKYVVYLTALGFVLTELGINYTAYLASLSVIGLAIAFGSQGLVQDMVTGFFIIFEGQFDVGDMVEIAPQTGVVEEIGLRMTKLRNYLGQQIVIPNRNIAVVGNYVKGAQQALVDVAAGGPEEAEKAAEILRGFVGEIARQFEKVILTAEVVGCVSLTTNEHFVRLHFSFWPQQQWVIEQQVVPRSRDVLKAAGYEVPGDRVAVFYYAREKVKVPGAARLPASRRRQNGTQEP